MSTLLAVVAYVFGPVLRRLVYRLAGGSLLGPNGREAAW